MSPPNKSLPIREQTFWGLTSILGGALGLSGMTIGGLSAKIYGDGAALSSIFIGNFILWLIGLAIISMVESRNHAIENIKNYLGKTTSVVASLVWIFAFLLWYVIQLKTTAEAIGIIFSKQTHPIWTIGALLGFATAILSIGGIRLISTLCTFVFPCLVGLALFFIATSQQLISFANQWSFSFTGILSVIFIWLPFTVNLPTIFRYSHSRANSVLGLSLITISRTFFQIFILSIGAENPLQWTTRYTEHILSIQGIAAIVFILLSYVVVNLLNVYFSIPGLDVIFIKHRHRLKYFMVGLVGTGLYILFQHSTNTLLLPYSVKFLEELLSSFIATLGAVLLIDFLIKSIVQHRPRPFEKFWSSVCWLAGCLSIVITQSKDHFNPEQTTFVGIVFCVLIFLIIIFIEETVWSIKQIRNRKTKPTL